MLFFDKSESPYSSLRLDGRDAIDFAHRIFSRNFKNLKIGEGVLTCLLSPEGKILSVFWAIHKGSILSLVGESECISALKDKIEHYHFGESFQLTQGPQIHWNFGESETNPETYARGQVEGTLFRGNWRGSAIVFDLDGAEPQANTTEASWSLHRIRHLIPHWGADFDSSTLVFEPGFEELCDENKGCYIGQEVVERVRTRGGHAVRKLVLIEWIGAELTSGAQILNEKDEPLGVLTSCVTDKKSTLSLGYLRTKNLERGFSVKTQNNSAAGKVIKIV